MRANLPARLTGARGGCPEGVRGDYHGDEACAGFERGGSRHRKSQGVSENVMRADLEGAGQNRQDEVSKVEDVRRSRVGKSEEVIS